MHPRRIWLVIPVLPEYCPCDDGVSDLHGFETRLLEHVNEYMSETFEGFHWGLGDLLKVELEAPSDDDDSEQPYFFFCFTESRWNLLWVNEEPPMFPDSITIDDIHPRVQCEALDGILGEDVGTERDLWCRPALHGHFDGATPQHTVDKDVLFRFESGRFIFWILGSVESGPVKSHHVVACKWIYDDFSIQNYLTLIGFEKDVAATVRQMQEDVKTYQIVIGIPC